MSVKNLSVISFFCIFFAFFPLFRSYADTLYLKDGRRVEGVIMQETRDIVVIKGSLGQTAFYRNNIHRMEKETAPREKKPPLGKLRIIRRAAKPAKQAEEAPMPEMHDFKLGHHKIEDDSIEFAFPERINTLYLFNIKDWSGPRGDKSRLVVKIYDKNRELISTGKSVYISKDTGSFGSICFNEITRNTVKHAGYFIVSVEDYDAEASDAGGGIAAGDIEISYEGGVLDPKFRTFMRFLAFIPLALFFMTFVFFAVCLQTIATKMGNKYGWLAWVPFVNAFLMCRLGGKPAWWFLLLLIPFANMIFFCLIWMGIAVNRGKPAWIGLLGIIPVINLAAVAYLAFSKQGAVPAVPEK